MRVFSKLTTAQMRDAYVDPGSIHNALTFHRAERKRLSKQYSRAYKLLLRNPINPLLREYGLNKGISGDLFLTYEAFVLLVFKKLVLSGQYSKDKLDNIYIIEDCLDQLASVISSLDFQKNNTHSIVYFNEILPRAMTFKMIDGCIHVLHVDSKPSGNAVSSTIHRALMGKRYKLYENECTLQRDFSGCGVFAYKALQYFIKSQGEFFSALPQTPEGSRLALNASQLPAPLLKLSQTYGQPNPTEVHPALLDTPVSQKKQLTLSAYYNKYRYENKYNTAALIHLYQYIEVIDAFVFDLGVDEADIIQHRLSSLPKVIDTIMTTFNVNSSERPNHTDASFSANRETFAEYWKNVKIVNNISENDCKAIYKDFAEKMVDVENTGDAELLAEKLWYLFTKDIPTAKKCLGYYIDDSPHYIQTPLNHLCKTFEMRPDFPGAKMFGEGNLKKMFSAPKSYLGMITGHCNFLLTKFPDVKSWKKTSIDESIRVIQEEKERRELLKQGVDTSKLSAANKAKLKQIAEINVRYNKPKYEHAGDILSALDAAKSSDHYLPKASLMSEEVELSAGYYITKLDADDVRCAMVGHFTGCCQHIGDSDGGAPAKHSITSELGGVYVLLKGTVKNGKTVANSKRDPIVAGAWAWVDLKEQGICLDSIEKDNQSARILEATLFGSSDPEKHEAMKILFLEFAKRLLEHPACQDIQQIRVGTGRNGKTPKNTGLQPIRASHLKSLRPDHSPGVPFRSHTDADTQNIIAHRSDPIYGIHAHNRDKMLRRLSMSKDPNIQVALAQYYADELKASGIQTSSIDQYDYRNFSTKEEALAVIDKMIRMPIVHLDLLVRDDNKFGGSLIESLFNHLIEDHPEKLIALIDRHGKREDMRPAYIGGVLLFIVTHSKLKSPSLIECLLRNGADPNTFDHFLYALTTDPLPEMRYDDYVRWVEVFNLTFLQVSSSGQSPLSALISKLSDNAVIDFSRGMNYDFLTAIIIHSGMIDSLMAGITKKALETEHLGRHINFVTNLLSRLASVSPENKADLLRSLQMVASTLPSEFAQRVRIAIEGVYDASVATIQSVLPIGNAKNDAEFWNDVLWPVFTYGFMASPAHIPWNDRPTIYERLKPFILSCFEEIITNPLPNIENCQTPITDKLSFFVAHAVQLITNETQLAETIMNLSPQTRKQLFLTETEHIKRILSECKAEDGNPSLLSTYVQISKCPSDIQTIVQLLELGADPFHLDEKQQTFSEAIEEFYDDCNPLVMGERPDSFTEHITRAFYQQASLNDKHLDANWDTIVARGGVTHKNVCDHVIKQASDLDNAEAIKLLEKSIETDATGAPTNLLSKYLRTNPCTHSFDGNPFLTKIKNAIQERKDVIGDKRTQSDCSDVEHKRIKLE